MASQWIPPDISQICAEATAPLTQCSQTGFLYLTLLSQLFGRSIDDEAFPKRNPYFNTAGQSFETSFLGPTHVPLGPTPLKLNPEINATPLGPLLPSSTINQYKSPNAKSYLLQTFYLKPDKEEPKFEFGRKFEHPYSKFDKSFEFGFNDDRYFDPATADSKKIPVTVEKTKSKSRKKRQAPEEYDFIIVGAGSAGCVLANRLSEVKKWKILLLEAGPEEPEVTSVPALAPVLGASSIDWGYRTQPEELTCLAQRGRTCAWIRGKTMGGSSAVNYMVYMRGNKADYDGWAAAGNLGWSYREVLPYFKKAENNQGIEAHNTHYHSVGGPLNVERFPYIDTNVLMLVEAFRERGLPVTDFNGENQFGTDVAQSTSLHGRRFSVNAAYIRPIRHIRPNLRIVNQAYVTKVIINPVTKTAVGVEYIKNHAVFTVYASKEVIASSGPVNSPKLLMLSGVGPKEQLAHHGIPVLSNIRVGYNLQDHVTTDALIISLSNKTSTMVDGQQLLDEHYDYYRQHSHKHGPLSSSSTLNAVAFIKTEFAEHGLPDIQFHFDGRFVEEFYADPATYLASNIFPLAFYNGIAARPLLLVPKSKGYISLNYTDPLFGSPLIYPRFLTERFDVDTLLSAMKFAVSLEETPAFKLSGAFFVKIPVPGCEGFLWGSDEYLTCLLTHYTSTIYHPAGTCKMGPSWDTEAVVDARLRVYGIKRLRVIDSSIMPQIIRGNLNAPTVMIAEKAADMIKEDYYSY